MKFARIAALVCCVLAVGCGESGPAGQPVYPVTGKITMNGAPLTDAAVSFAPKSGQPTAVGMTDQNGEFTLTTYQANDGAAAGDYAVVVTKVISASTPEVQQEEHSMEPNAPSGGEHSLTESGTKTVLMVPPKYSNANETPLKASVKAGETNHFEFKVE